MWVRVHDEKAVSIDCSFEDPSTRVAPSSCVSPIHSYAASPYAASPNCHAKLWRSLFIMCTYKPNTLQHSDAYSTAASQHQGANLGVLAGALLQVLHVHLLCLSERLVVRLVDGLLQPEGVVAVNLLPVDGAIRAVDRLVPQLFMGREWSTVSDFVFVRHNGTCSAQDVLCAGDDRPQADTFVQQTSTDLATDVACARVPAGSWGIEHQKGAGRHVMASPKARRHTASQTCCVSKERTSLGRAAACDGAAQV